MHQLNEASQIADDRLEASLTDRMEHAERQDAIADALRLLAPRQRDIIVRHFGLNGEDAVTLSAIAAEANLSPERIRQIKDRAIRKLSRHISQGFTE